MSDILLKIDENALPSVADAIKLRTGKTSPLAVKSFPNEIKTLVNPDLYTPTIPNWCGKYALQAVDVARSYFDARFVGLINFSHSKTNIFEGVLSDANKYGVIDDATYVSLVLRGISFENSPYANITGANQSYDSTKIEARTDLYDWVYDDFDLQGDRVRHADSLAQYMWMTGRVFTDASLTKAGDLVFFASKESDGSYTEPDKFKHVSQVGIITHENFLSSSEVYTFFTVDDTGAVQMTKASSRDDAVFFARPNYEKNISYEEFSPDINLLTYPWHSVSKTVNGMTCTVNKDGTLVFSTKPTSTTKFQIISDMLPLTLEAGTYRLQGCPVHPNSPTGTSWGLILETVGTSKRVTDNGSGSEFTFDEKEIVEVYISIANSVTPDGHIWKPQLFRIA